MLVKRANSDTMDVLTLIRLVRVRQPLWDRKHRYYHDRNVTMALWEEVANNLQVDSDSCRSKWKGLRDTFRTELRKLNKIRQKINTPHLQATNWEYFNEMLFVKDQIYLNARSVEQAVKESLSQMSAPEDCYLDLSKLCKTEVVEPEDQEMPSVIDPSKRDSDSEDERPTKRHKAEEQDDNYNFLLSLSPQLRALPLTRNAFVRMKIQQLLYSELSMLEQNSQNGDVSEMEPRISESQHTAYSVSNATPRCSLSESQASNNSLIKLNPRCDRIKLDPPEEELYE